MSSSVIVVPCFNEATRLRGNDFTRFATPETRVLFVDDGSNDATPERLAQLVREEPDRFEVLTLESNRGKAEAVRRGMLAALASEAHFVGYWDADLATPLDEVARFRAYLEGHPRCQVVLGSRVQLLGRSIERSALRHYVGRVFATCASLALDLPVYDTQCGAKLFRAGPEATQLFAEPFRAGWAFDVEWIARWIRDRRADGGIPAEEAIAEVPLEAWHDIAGSKVKPWDLVRALLDVARVRAHYL
ncbi:MAG: glycosyltransferase [Myxococcota bacterium]